MRDEQMGPYRVSAKPADVCTKTPLDYEDYLYYGMTACMYWWLTILLVYTAVVLFF